MKVYTLNPCIYLIVGRNHPTIFMINRYFNKLMLKPMICWKRPVINKFGMIYFGSGHALAQTINPCQSIHLFTSSKQLRYLVNTTKSMSHPIIGGDIVKICK